VTAVPGNRMHEHCGSEPFPGFHWCSVGLAPDYVSDSSLMVSRSALAPTDAGVEAIERLGPPVLPGHGCFSRKLDPSTDAPLHRCFTRLCGSPYEKSPHKPMS